ncbi:MAG: methyl-accepting chemotaxis protein [Magnetospirillum sp.]|nr:methyl-accepting chemotaxis protein [Magnetospirillum sp.]
MGINEEVAKAFGAHAAWKTRIRQTIDSGYSEYKPEDVGDDHRCAFGTWLHDPSLPGSVRDSREYRTVVRLHADFHRAAASSLSKALGGDTHGAQADLAEGAFAQAADALSGALVRWQRDAATECSGSNRRVSRLWRRLCRFWAGRVSARVWTVVAIPALLVVLVAGWTDVSLMRTARKAGHIHRIAAVIGAATSLADSLEREQALSVGRRPLDAAQAATRAALADFDRSLATANDPPDAGLERFGTAGDIVRHLDDIRPQLGAMSSDDILTFYGTAIDALLVAGESAMPPGASADLRAAFSVLDNVAQAKEAAARFRGEGAGALADGTIAAAHDTFVDQAAAEREHLAVAVANLPESWLKTFGSLFTTNDEGFQSLKERLLAGNATGVSPQDWLTVASRHVDGIGRIETAAVGALAQAADAALDQADHRLAVFNGLTAAALLATGLLTTLIIRGIVGPTIRLTAAMRDLAGGQAGIVIPSLERSDEIGEMARALLVFQQQALSVERLTAEQEEQRRASEEARRQALLTMADTIETQTSGVVSRVGEESRRVGSTAARMAQSAACVEENAQRVAAAAEQSLANAQAVAGASEQLSASIREIAAQVERSKAMVGEAVDAAGNASATVASLAQAMAAIDDVVQVIAQIASQTNLLALNATIEAARAGDAGKGFAVVAHEVKNLANQTARQTEDITARITTLKEMAQRVTSAIADVVEDIHGVEEIATSVAAAVEEQDAATGEIARNVQQSAQAAQEVTERIVAVASEASSTGKQAAMVETLLEAMAEQVAELGQVLTRVVRTATPEVDRRTNQRYAVKADARVACAHGQVEGELADISAGGARIVHVQGRTQQGQQGDLHVEDVRAPVTVIDSGDDVCRVKADGGPNEAMGHWIARKLAAGGLVPTQ